MKMCRRKKPKPAKEPETITPNVTKEQLTDIYTYIAQMSEKIYDRELQRYTALIEQAGRMQSAFSFVFAAIYLIAPIVIDNLTNVPKAFWGVSFTAVGIILMFSIFAATRVQDLRQANGFPNADTFQNYVLKEYDKLSDEAHRQKFTADTYAQIQKSIAKTNSEREHWIKVSMIAFYIALILCSISVFAGNVLYYLC